MFLKYLTRLQNHESFSYSEPFKLFHISEVCTCGLPFLFYVLFKLYIFSILTVICATTIMLTYALHKLILLCACVLNTLGHYPNLNLRFLWNTSTSEEQYWAHHHCLVIYCNHNIHNTIHNMLQNDLLILMLTITDKYNLLFYWLCQQVSHSLKR